ncbi:G-type lectin S-receptor-like serine/threonine-protein kinase At2g19130 [Selaginella moellendorffii]|nr:G-type lectin S-receptor-like serine/threonine-protein kinase At2g19130 [Selaginella moellendorffii]|eukprot:XP_024517474.1 G-type lectin S-receptor-like serine/threonine-protein kinase At2g19130 [Selaginella moellendorffii]
MLVPVVCLWMLLLSRAEAQSLTPGSILTPGSNRFWTSSNGMFGLGFFNSSAPTTEIHVGIAFVDQMPPTLVWMPNRTQSLSSNSSLQVTDSGLVIIESGETVWRSGAAGAVVAEAELLDVGNFVLRSASSNIVWQSFDFPTDTLLLGQKLLPIAGQALSSWRTKADPKPGPFSMVMDGDMSKPRLLYQGAIEYWSWTTAKFNEFRFSDDPGNETTGNLTVGSIIQDSYCDAQLVSTEFANYRKRLTLDPDGNFRYYVRAPNSTKWGVVWRALFDACDVYSTCGINGLCDFNSPANSKPPAGCPVADEDPHPCSCPPGYRPVDSSEPQIGCQPQEPLRCPSRDFQKLNDTVFAELLPSKEADYRNIKESECVINCGNQLNCSSCAAAVYSTASSECWLVASPLVNGSISSSSGKLVYVRVPPSNSSSGGGLTLGAKVGIGIGTPSFLLVLLLCSVLGSYEYKRYRKGQVLKHGVSEGVGGLQKFSYDYLKCVTKDFANVLGQGGYGAVYLGVLPDDTRVAVKLLNEGFPQEFDSGSNEDKSFLAEVATLANIRHSNVVHLLGFCLEAPKHLLVYEYLENKSLDKVLFEPTTPLTKWKTRMQILIGAARGIEYFHSYSGDRRVVHRDIKPANVLLTADFHAKVADFGLAKIMDTATHTTNFTMPGTVGYRAPECTIIGDAITVQADVFSFGVVCIEVVSGRRLVYVEQQGRTRVLLFRRALELMLQEEYMKLVDERLAEDGIDEDEVRKVVRVAGWCLQEDPKQRPTMDAVVALLNDDTKAVEMPPLEGSLPAYVFRNFESEDEVSVARLTGDTLSVGSSLARE